MTDQGILVELQRQIDKLGRRLADLETQEANMANNHGYIGGAWQKDPIALGYSDTVIRSVTNTSTPAGASDQNDTAVPAGEIWVITNISIAYSGTVTGVIISAQLVIDSTNVTVFQANPPASGVFYDRQGNWILGPGDNLRLAVSGATLNDDVYLRATGFRVDIDL